MSVTYTQMCKGVAMLLIMVGHCTGHFIGGRLLTPCGGIGVSIFLIVSGFGLNESFKISGLGKFWSKRVLRVWIPYVIITCMFSIFSFKSIGYLFSQLIGIHCAYWFVTYILIWYVVFYLTLKIKWVSKYRMLIMFAFSLSTLFFMESLRAEQALGFVSGVWISQHIDDIRNIFQRKRSVLTFVALLSLVGMMALAIKQMPIVREYEGHWIFNILQLLIKWPISLALIGGLFYVPFLANNPFLLLTGLISYELYLVHFRFYGLIESYLWIAFAVIIGSYIVSWGLYKLNRIIVHRLL